MKPEYQTPYQSADTLVKELRSGDLVEIKRVRTFAYKHWCVYFGIDAHTQEHIVYHFGQRDNPSASPSNISAEICMAPLKEVAKNCQCRKNNEKDSVRPAFSENDIRQRCLARAARHARHNVADYNSEHFAKWARNNLFQSDILKELYDARPSTHELISPEFIANRRILETMLLDIQFGDLIVIERTRPTNYNHWGVYFGEDEDGQHLICHFWDDPLQNGVIRQDHIKVALSVLTDITFRYFCRKDNDTDDLVQPSTPDVIRERCEMLMGNGEFEFNAINFEHFAKFARYGDGGTNFVSRLPQLQDFISTEQHSQDERNELFTRNLSLTDDVFIV